MQREERNSLSLVRDCSCWPRQLHLPKTPPTNLDWTHLVGFRVRSGRSTPIQGGTFGFTSHFPGLFQTEHRQSLCFDQGHVHDGQPQSILTLSLEVYISLFLKPVRAGFMPCHPPPQSLKVYPHYQSPPPLVQQPAQSITMTYRSILAANCATGANRSRKPLLSVGD